MHYFPDSKWASLNDHVYPLMVAFQMLYEENLCHLKGSINLMHKTHSRSLHTESEIFIWNFRTLKNKYDLTLCQSRLHTASETFVHQKQFGSGSIFCVFASVACILIGKDGEYEKTEKRMRNSVWTQCAMTFTLKMLLWREISIKSQLCLYICLHDLKLYLVNNS